MSFLTEVLGLEGLDAKLFDNQIDKLESKVNSSKHSLSAKITADLHQQSAEIAEKLGFGKGDITGQEAYSSLKNIARASNDDQPSKDWLGEYKSNLLLTLDGPVSVNHQDIRQSVEEELDFSQRPFDNFRRELLDKIAEQYSSKINHIAKQQIKQQLKGE